MPRSANHVILLCVLSHMPFTSAQYWAVGDLHGLWRVGLRSSRVEARPATARHGWLVLAVLGCLPLAYTADVDLAGGGQSAWQAGQFLQNTYMLGLEGDLRRHGEGGCVRERRGSAPTLARTSGIQHSSNHVRLFPATT